MASRRTAGSDRSCNYWTPAGELPESELSAPFGALKARLSAVARRAPYRTPLITNTSLWNELLLGSRLNAQKERLRNWVQLEKKVKNYLRNTRVCEHQQAVILVGDSTLAVAFITSPTGPP